MQVTSGVRCLSSLLLLGAISGCSAGPPPCAAFPGKSGLSLTDQLAFPDAKADDAAAAQDGKPKRKKAESRPKKRRKCHCPKLTPAGHPG